MQINILENGERVEEKHSRSHKSAAVPTNRAAIRSGQNPRGVTSGANVAVPHRKRHGHHVVRRILSLKMGMRNHWAIIVPIHDSLWLQAVEQSMWPGNALTMVYRHIRKSRELTFRAEREPTDGVLLALESRGRKKQHDATR